MHTAFDSTNRKKTRILELGCGQVKAPGAVGVDSNFDATAVDIICNLNRLFLVTPHYTDFIS